jgi:ComF family protein
MLKDFLAGLVDILFPPACILCKMSISLNYKKTQVCHACQDSIKKNNPPFCGKCSRPLKNPLRDFCKICEHQSLHFDHAWGACRYDDTMKRLIHLFKYGQKTALRHLFFSLINDFVQNYNIKIRSFDHIIPVPIHPTRLRERGFNQSELIAQIISDNYHIPLSKNSLIRIRHTPNQARVSKKERWTNTYQAFRIKQPFHLTNKNILIIDDLYTTGATSCEIARILKNAGAGKVCILTLAIAP